MSASNNNVYVFIDAANIWDVYKTKGHLLDFDKLKKYLKGEFDAANLEIFYYTAYPADDTRDYSLDGRHKFYTYLKKALDFNVRKKKLKRIRIVTEEGEAWEEKGDMDVELTIDAMHHLNKYDTAIFFTGDSDFLKLVTYLQNAGGKQVYVYSSENNISHELRSGADEYIDMLKIDADIWGNELKHRKELEGE